MVVESTLGSLDLRLAAWEDANEVYRRRYLPVEFESEQISGDRSALTGSPSFRPFAMRSWKGGEGITWWERDKARFRSSSNVRPTKLREGLELGADQSVTVDAAAAVFNDGSRFGYGLGQLWTADDGSGYPWDSVNTEWDAGITIGAGTSDVTSMTDGDDTFIYSGAESKAIWRWKSGTSTEHFTAASGFVYAPVVRSFEGTLYALDGDDLYEIDKVTANTRTQKGDLTNGSSAVYLASTPWAYGRMSLSDRGPIWVQRLDNGQTFLWLYDPNNDVQERLGKLPVDFAFPYSTFFAKGFAFVGFRYASSHAAEGQAYLWYKRGAQDGVAGPFRSLTGVTASKPVLIAGIIGDDLLCYYDGAIWGYNLTDGGIFMVSKQTTTGTPEDATTFGKDVFITPVTSGANTMAVERFDTEAYTTETATIDLGKHDWDYPGLTKILLDVTVITDPLPANTSVAVSVSVDGGSFTALSGSHDTDDATKKTFTASTSAGTTFAGNEFELRITLATTANTATPTIREVSARATSSAHILEVRMIVDAGSVEGQSSHTLIDGLNLLAAPTTPAVVSFTDRFQNRDRDDGDTMDVTIKDVGTPILEDDGRVSALVVVQKVGLV